MIPRLSLLLCALALLISPALADDLIFSNAWIRATKGKTMHTAGYVTIENTTTVKRRIVAAKIIAPAGLQAMLSIHETTEKDGVFSMQPLKNGLEIPAGETRILKPKGLHLMVMQLNQKLPPTSSDVTIEFLLANETTRQVRFSVREKIPLTAQSPD